MRTEEEKAADILYYEKKAAARDFVADFEKKLSRSRIICAVCTVIAVAASISSILNAYDSENTALVIIIILALAVFSAVCFTVSGSVMCRSLPAFFKWRSLRAKFRSAEEIMSKVEEKFLDSTAFEPEAKNAEETLISISEAVIEFADKQKK